MSRLCWLVLVLPAVSQAQERGTLLLPPEDRYASLLSVAAERIEKKDWAVAVTLLQKLIDDDFLCIVHRKGPDGKERAEIVSTWAEANRLLSTLPREGWAFYEREQGAKAAELLKQVEKDKSKFVEIARHYLWTDAGDTAARWLFRDRFPNTDMRFLLEVARRRSDRSQWPVVVMARDLVDAGEPYAAALCFDFLLDRKDADELGIAEFFQAAKAYKRTGDAKRFEQAWKAVNARAGKEDLVIGEKKLTLDDMKREVEKLKPAKPSGEQRQWRMFRGDPSRVARSAGGMPQLEPRWKHELTVERETRGWVALAKLGNWETLLSPFHPLALVAKVDGNDVPLVCYRTFSGWTARALKDVPKEDLKEGGLHWEAISNWSVDRMAREARFVGHLNTWLRDYVTQGIRPGVLFENTLAGTLSTDGKLLYSVEDFQIPPTNPKELLPLKRMRPWDPLGGTGPDFHGALIHNRLQAYDLESGKLQWETSVWPEPPLPADSFFLSAPLVLNGKLHVLNERLGELRLLTLEPQTGKVLSVHPLARLREKITDGVLRRLEAAHLAHFDGVLVCPTHAGAVLGVELKSGRLLWTFGYLPRVRKPAEKGEQPVLTEGISRWQATAPLIAQGRVIVAPADSDTLSCINLRDGQLLWQEPRGEGLYVGGILGDVVLIVGKRYCRGLKLADGKELWKLETGTPSGLGVAVGGRYFLPLAECADRKEPGIAVLDPIKGVILSQVRSRNKEVPGNLCFLGDTLISQTPTHIAAYPLVK
jgi:outer membrane protein assembly factor BamB